MYYPCRCQEIWQKTITNLRQDSWWPAETVNGYLQYMSKSVTVTSTQSVENMEIRFNVTNLLSVLDTTSTLLTMPGSKFVSNLRNAN